MQLTINFIHNSSVFIIHYYGSQSHSHFCDKIPTRETISKNSQNFHDSEGVDLIFHACAKVCLKFLKFTKLPNFERDKHVSVKSSCKGTELFCVANGSAESSF